MQALLSVFARASARIREGAVRSPRKRTNKALLICGLLTVLAIGSATSARAQSYDFTYSGSGISAAGTFQIAFNGGPVTTLTGTRTSVLDGTSPMHWENPGFWTEDPGAPFGGYGYFSFFIDPGGHDFNVYVFNNANELDQGVSPGNCSTTPLGCVFSPPFGDPGALPGFVYPAQSGDGRIGVHGGEANPIQFTVTRTSPNEVPEINASAGLEALAVLFVFGLILREMFLRRRFVLRRAA